MARLSQAVALADWTTLGYGSLVEYAEAEGIAAAFAAAAQQEGELLPGLVAELRHAGLSQKQAGAVLGITQARVSQLERGKSGNESRDKSAADAGTSHLPAGKNISHPPETDADQGKEDDLTYIPAQAADVEHVDAPPTAVDSEPSTPTPSDEVGGQPASLDGQPASLDGQPDPALRIAELEQQLAERDERLEQWKARAETWYQGVQAKKQELGQQLAAAQDRIAELEQRLRMALRAAQLPGQPGGGYEDFDPDHKHLGRPVMARTEDGSCEAGGCEYGYDDPSLCPRRGAGAAARGAGAAEAAERGAGAAAGAGAGTAGRGAGPGAGGAGAGDAEIP
jgi:transcriptional regulator with XRE-family HTH domain